MKPSTLLEYALVGLLGVVLVSLLLGQLLGYPVGLGYVDSDSMEPTLNEGDGFIAVPSAIAGDIGEGDVVVFEADEVHGGEVTTHRIVEERPDGYVTQGDNNPFTDQGTGEPAVTDGQVKATALTVDGTVVRIPRLGAAAGAVGSAVGSVEQRVAQLFGVRQLGGQQLSYLLFALGVLAFALLLMSDRRASQGRTRSRSRARDVVFDTRLLLVAGVGLLCAGATLGMVVPAGSETYGIVSTEGNSSNPTIVPQGESDSFQYQVGNGGYLPTVSYFETQSDGVDIDPDRVRLGRGESTNTTVTFDAPDETGYYLRSTSEHRYFVVVPPSLLDSLYEVHPWMPYLLVNAVVVTPFVLLWLLFAGPSKVRRRSRQRDRASGLLERIQ